MRLIDADKLIEDVLNSMPTGSARGVFRAFIEEQPTAYDVDKVVKELEALDNAEVDYYTSNDVIDRIDTLDIVRKGGIDE